MLINSKETSRERDKSSNSSLRSLCEHSQTKKQLIQLMWSRSESAVRVWWWHSDIPKDSERSLCKHKWLITASTLWLAAFFAYANGVFVALSWRPTLFLLCVYLNLGSYSVHVHSVHRFMVFYNVLGDPSVTNEDAVALLPQCPTRLYCMYLGVLHYRYLTTQLSPSGRSSGVTEV